MHLIIDGYGCSAQQMENVDLVYQILDQFPSRIGMTKIGRPQVSRHGGSGAGDAGISGFVLLAESHISIHIFPESSYINVDIFSCKEFDAEQALGTFQERFPMAKIRTYVLNRPPSGLE